MRVGLRERSGNAAQPGGEHLRSRGVTAAAEHDVGPSARDDSSARDRRGGSEPGRANEPDAGTPWEPGHPERVERVPTLRNEPSLDAIRRPGEGHRHPPRAQRFRHRERRGDVPHRSPGRDQSPQLSLRRHHGRC
jgi:hypothetical protein